MGRTVFLADGGRHGSWGPGHLAHRLL